MMQFSRQGVKGNGGQRNRNLCISLLAGILCLTGWLYWQLSSAGTQQEKQLANEMDESTKGIIQTGTVVGVEYNTCQSDNDKHLVLLHGSAFTKEDWKTSLILSKFCGHISVTALDLSVSAKCNELMNVLDALHTTKNIISSFPIAGLVTPSASGSTIVDGMLSSQIDSLQERIQTWIPVATNGVLRVPREKLQTNHWDILAIYGDQDVGGKQSSRLWEEVGHAKVVELTGRHPVYLDSPDEFVKVILSHLLEE